MKKFMKTRAQLINEMKIILLYEMNHEIEGLFHDVHLGGLHRERSATAATAVKPVPARHKREIIVTRDKACTTIDDRTNREYIEQLNKAGLKGQILAVRSLPSGDLILTTDEEATRTEWL
jgi:hypothetical protein